MLSSVKKLEWCNVRHVMSVGQRKIWVSNGNRSHDLKLVGALSTMWATERLVVSKAIYKVQTASSPGVLVLGRARFAWRSGPDADGEADALRGSLPNHQPPRSLFSRLTASTSGQSAPGDEAEVQMCYAFSILQGSAMSIAYSLSHARAVFFTSKLCEDSYQSGDTPSSSKISRKNQTFFWHQSRLNPLPTHAKLWPRPSVYFRRVYSGTFPGSLTFCG